MNLLDIARSSLSSNDSERAGSPTQRRATHAEVAELGELIAEILAGDSEDDRVEALEVASRDVEAALLSFRTLRHELRENRKWLPQFRDTYAHAREGGSHEAR